MALLEIKNLSAGYGDFAVLKNISLEISPGEIIELIQHYRKK